MHLSSFHRGKYIVETLTQKGHIAYFAGGWVRDFLLKHPSDDIDIATSASPEEVQNIFPNTIPIGLAFGIILVIVDKEPFEVATFRRDIDYIDGRRPSKVEYCDPKEDACRRDFTINGMFYDPLQEKVLDYVDGKKDLKQQIIRAIGTPDKRFEEDRLRMIRAVRMATRFHFTIEEDTKKAIDKHAKELLPAVAIERVWQELVKMSRYSNFAKACHMLFDFGLLQVIFPTILKLPEKEFLQQLEKIEKMPKEYETIVKIMPLLAHHSLKEIEHLSLYLKLSSYERGLALFCSKYKTIFAENLPLSWSDYEWTYFLANPAADNTIVFLLLSSHNFKAIAALFEEKSALLQQEVARRKEKRYLLSASQLQEEGIVPGKIMGKLLEEGEKFAVNYHLTDAKKVLDLLKKSPLWPSKS